MNSLFLFPKEIFSSKLQLWRLITNLFFFGPFSINYVFNFMFFLNFLSYLEKDQFDRKPADFVFVILFGSFFLTLAGIFFELPLLSFSFMAYVVYIWCQYNPTKEVGLFMIRILISLTQAIQVKAIYFRNFNF